MEENLPVHEHGPDTTVASISDHRANVIRRLCFVGSVVVVNILATLWLADLYWRLGMHKGHAIILLLFFILNGLLCLGSMHAVAGVWDLLRGRRKGASIMELSEGLSGSLKMRHAVVMPVYNEDIVKVCARVEAIHESIRATGNLDSYDFYILSDTTNLDCWIEEEVAWTNMCRRLDGFGRIFYRRRSKNTNRKAGNIGDFVRTWGGRYEAMLVLDADSLMDGGDIVRMTRVMEAYPRLGILQTPPKLIRGSSVFTRMQQFAMRLYGPLFIRGLNYWQRESGSYWGHNALIRVKPFSEFCELPALPGREPFGGRILSHDFVEAALMVREKWEVWLAYDIVGTYEEAPPTLVDHLKRDRRWCQGNLQHLWLIFARKFPAPSRLHLFMGIMAYLGSPLWFLFLLFNTWLAWERSHSGLSDLPFPGVVGSLFGISTQAQALVLLVLVASMLFLPKLTAMWVALKDAKTRREFGGGLRLLCGVMMEMTFSTLLAPAVMFAHTMMIFGMVLGRSVSWGNQTRETDGTAWRDALMFHGLTMVVGCVWSVLAWDIGVSFLVWISPILVGLVGSVVISVLTSRTRYGLALQRRGILSIPEEIDEPSVMKLADEAQASVDVALSANVISREGVVAAIVDPYVNGVHVSLLGAVEEEESHEVVERVLREGVGVLEKQELSDLLYHSAAVLALHRAVWLRPFEELHRTWQEAVQSYRTREMNS